MAWVRGVVMVGLMIGVAWVVWQVVKFGIAWVLV
jgi:hypothetical protein